MFNTEDDITVSLLTDSVFVNVNGATQWIFQVKPTNAVMDILWEDL